MRKIVCMVAVLSLGACEDAGQPAQPSRPAGATPAATGGGAAPGQTIPVANGQAPSSTDAHADPSTPGAQFAAARGGNLMWKRYAALEADLMRALELGRAEVCTELGGRSCTRDVHTIALGGNDPFRSGINRPSAEPSGTTPIAVDRVVLSACSARARADTTAAAKVFTALDLRGPAPSPDAPAVETTIRDLYRRLLARDPRAHEANMVSELLDPAQPDAPQSGEEFAILACYAIGSSLEFLFH